MAPDVRVGSHQPVNLATGSAAARKRALNSSAAESIKLSLVVPVFNEEDAVSKFLTEVDNVLGKIPGLSLEILFVNDGSVDATLEHLVAYQADDSRIRIVDLSRNFGKEAALTAGLDFASGDVMIPIDVDLQDPPALILEMLELWRQGFDVVLARRVDRQSDTWGKRTAAKYFYRVHNMISEPKIPEDVGDFRLMDRTVVQALKGLPESRRFMKGLLAWLGFKTTYVDYTRLPRAAGQTKWSRWRLWNLAIEGFTSFSLAPLRVWTYIGLTLALLTFFYGFFIAIRVLLFGVDVPGYASIFFAVTILSSIQLIGIGVIGEYIGRIYVEAKRRPVYLVRKTIEPNEDKKGE